MRVLTKKQHKKYTKDCELFHRIAKKTFSDIDIILRFNDDTNLFEFVLGGEHCVITILPDAIWKNIQKYIQLKLKGFDGDECDICYSKIEKRTTCPQCFNQWCVNCYINLFRNGCGVIKCPMCRMELGEEMPKELVELGIIEIKMKCGMKLFD